MGKITSLIYNSNKLYGYFSNNHYYYIDQNGTKKRSSICFEPDDVITVLKRYCDKIIIMVTKSFNNNVGDIYYMYYGQEPKEIAKNAILFTIGNEQNYVVFLMDSKKHPGKYVMYASTGEKTLAITDNFDYEKSMKNIN